MPEPLPISHEQIWKNNLKYFRHTEIPHPKILVAFAGIPGSGKTTLATLLEDRFKGTRFKSDDVRDILGSLMPGSSIIERNDIIKSYESYALDKLSQFPNGLLILDSGIDRKYQKISEWATQNNYQRLTIGFEVPRDIAEARLKASKTNYQDYFKEMDRWIKEHGEFSLHVVPDIILNPTDSPTLVFPKLQAMLAAV